MQYPFTIFSEWRPTNDPLFCKTKRGDEYSLISLGKTFKNGDSTIRDTVKIQCFGDENTKIRSLMERYGSIKGIPLDVYADRIPYSTGGEICYSYRATKVSIGSSYFYSKTQENVSKPQVISELDNM